jgi:hypothetical protein
MSKLRGCSVILRATVDYDTGGCGRALSGESVVMPKERARLSDIKQGSYRTAALATVVLHPAPISDLDRDLDNRNTPLPRSPPIS